MKTFILRFTILAFFLSSFLMLSCNKDEKLDDPNDEATQKNLAIEANFTANVNDEISNNVNYVVNATIINGNARENETFSSPCSISSIINDEDSSMSVTFNGDNCIGTLNLKGFIHIKLIPPPVKEDEIATAGNWSNENSTLVITITNLVVKRNADGRYITINGVKRIKNLSGGTIYNPRSNNEVIHQEKSQMTIKFDTLEGTREYWVAKTRKLLINDNNEITYSVSGDHTIGALVNVAEWGFNRLGKEFKTNISQSVVSSLCPNFKFRTLSGVVIHIVDSRAITFNFGVSSDGSFDGTCSSYGYKISWLSLGGLSKELIIPYK